MIRPRAVLAIARKDTLDILLNRSNLFALAAPLLLTLLYLLITRLTAGSATTMLVYNPGDSGVQQAVSSAFATTRVTRANSPADVTAAFGPNGTRKNAAYDIGLIIPANFEHDIQAGGHPQVTLYFNGNAISDQQRLLLQASVSNYSRMVATPQPPASLVVSTINPPRATSVAQGLSSVYGPISLLLSLSIGLTLMPIRLIEEKERKTLRMILVAPASYGDVILGKLLPILAYQLILSVVLVAIINQGLSGNIPLLLLYILLGACFALAMGLLVGSLVQTSSAASAMGGLLSFVVILPGIFVGALGKLIGNNGSVIQISRLIPTWYVAEGALNALRQQGSFSGNLLDIGVSVGTTLVILTLSIWFLYRQASVVGAL